MTILVTAPEPFDRPGFKVFLAGPIDMGTAPDWQGDVIDALRWTERVVVLNPRRAHFDRADLDEQIRWELAALEAADLILMWFPRDTGGPIAMLETGLYLRSGKLVIGAERGFSRRRNLEITTQRFGVPLWSRLDELVGQALARRTAAAERERTLT